MKKDDAIEVLIVGAGAAGLTLAIELARRDIDFRVIDKAPVPFAGSRGKGIQPRSQEIFEDLGLIDRLMAVGGEYADQRLYREDGSHEERALGERTPPTPAEPYHWALMVPQSLTEQLMRERLLELGYRVEFGRELREFTQHEQDVIAHVGGMDGAETIRARYLIGADGGRSFVRKRLGIDFPGKTLGVHALVADVELEGLGRDAWHQFNPGDMAAMLSICPLAGTPLFQIQAPIPPEPRPDLSPAGLNRLILERTGRDDIEVRTVSWASNYQMNARLAERYRAGYVFLVGDAAHIHPPTGGQGLNTGVQDAYNLGWKLAAVLRGANAALLDSYEAERLPVAQAMLGLTSRLLDEQKQGEMRRGRETQQLDIGYPDSPLNTSDQGRSRQLRPGDRAPDAPLRGAAGQVIRLFNLLQGTHWTLLAHDAQRDMLRARPGLRIHHIGAHGELRDEWQHFHSAYGLSEGECVLIRPDGYIAAIFGADTITHFDAWTKKWGLFG